MSNNRVKSASKRMALEIAVLTSSSLSWGIVFALAFAEWINAYDNWKAFAMIALLLSGPVAVAAFRLFRTSAVQGPATT